MQRCRLLNVKQPTQEWRNGSTTFAQCEATNANVNCRRQAISFSNAGSMYGSGIWLSFGLAAPDLYPASWQLAHFTPVREWWVMVANHYDSPKKGTQPKKKALIPSLSPSPGKSRTSTMLKFLLFIHYMPTIISLPHQEATLCNNVHCKRKVGYLLWWCTVLVLTT